MMGEGERTLVQAIAREIEGSTDARPIERIRVSDHAVAGTVVWDLFNDGRSSELLVHPDDFGALCGIADDLGGYTRDGKMIVTKIWGLPVVTYLPTGADE